MRNVGRKILFKQPSHREGEGKGSEINFINGNLTNFLSPKKKKKKAKTTKLKYLLETLEFKHLQFLAVIYIYTEQTQ